MKPRDDQRVTKRFGDARDVETLTDGAISRRMAWTMARRGDLPPGVAIKLGGRVAFDLDRLEDWLEAGGGASERA